MPRTARTSASVAPALIARGCIVSSRPGRCQASRRGRLAGVPPRINPRVRATFADAMADPDLAAFPLVPKGRVLPVANRLDSVERDIPMELRWKMADMAGPSERLWQPPSYQPT